MNSAAQYKVQSWPLIRCLRGLNVALMRSIDRELLCSSGSCANLKKSEWARKGLQTGPIFTDPYPVKMICEGLEIAGNFI